MNFIEKPKFEFILLAIDDIISLIDKANNAIERHKEDILQVQQYEKLKEQHVKELQDLLLKVFSEHQISLKLTA